MCCIQIAVAVLLMAAAVMAAPAAYKDKQDYVSLMALFGF